MEIESKYIYVNQDGTVRELSTKECAYLSEKFDPCDGARPYIKSSYETRNGWGSISGFLLRRKVPTNLDIQPVNPSYDSELQKVLDVRRANLRQILDGPVSKPQPNRRSVQENFEISRREYLDWVLKKERLARHPDYGGTHPS